MKAFAKGGYLRVGRVGGVPIRIHWATPVGLFVFTGFSVHPIAWAAFLFIIVIHELGHAALVKCYRLTVVSIDLTALGGECRWAGDATPIRESVIAWGGVLAQGLLLALAAALHLLVSSAILEAFVYANVYLIAFNLLPLPMLDGWKAWALFRWRNLRLIPYLLRRRVLRARAAALQAELDRLQERERDPKMLN